MSDIIYFRYKLYIIIFHFLSIFILIFTTTVQPPYIYMPCNKYYTLNKDEKPTFHPCSSQKHPYFFIASNTSHKQATTKAHWLAEHYAPYQKYNRNLKLNLINKKSFLCFLPYDHFLLLYKRIKRR